MDTQLNKYAELAVKVGINIQRGQYLWVSAPIGTEDFVRKVVKEAYLAGAKKVHVNWYDEEILRTHYELAPDEVFLEFPSWEVQATEEVVDDGGAFLYIDATDPDLLNGIPVERIMNFQKAQGVALEKFREAIQIDAISWSILAIPNTKWADKVFPSLPEENRVEALWESIFQAVRIHEENPISAWKIHIETLKERADLLTEKKYKKLHYAGPGTDLTIELPDKHLWLTGSSMTPQGITFVANMPTEEVYTVPLKTGINGYVTSTKPLAYQGNVIEQFTLTFENGEIVKIEAETGENLLQQLIETDDGACFIGEVALVPHQSPISSSGILFFNTLFDENASNHLAIGSAYPTCYEGGSNMTEEERLAVGLNDSIVHEDFMIGSEKMNIDGIYEDESREPIFRNGNWAF
ncbi:aminopeptidase [Bacillus sp. 2205SS5-2]|uniref:aminopeptidase n=1 Tax=Bacillus sp. 2205SS5-2 TaxID=3109031 RepID=UPI003005E0B2